MQIRIDILRFRDDQDGKKTKQQYKHSVTNNKIVKIRQHRLK